MNSHSLPQSVEPDNTVAFGDVRPSRTPVELSVSEAQVGLQDSTEALGAVFETDAEADLARGVTSERRPKAEGQVDATPLAQRE